MKKNDEKYIFIVFLIITIFCYITLLTWGHEIFPSYDDCNEEEVITVTDTIFVYRRDTIVLLPSQNIEDIKKNLNVIKK